jgi:hypothetical protein
MFIEGHREISKEIKSFLAQSAKLIVDKAWRDVAWNIILDMFGFGEIINELPRFYNSWYYGDPDYPENVYWALELAYKKDHQRALAMIVYIIQDIHVREKDLEKYPAIKTILENKDLVDFSQLIPKIKLTFTRYLDIIDVPDPFYRDLIDLINKCYSYGIYPAVLVFGRKLLENLLVDIIRRKYGGQNVELFFDTKHRRFRNFNELVKVFKERLNDFKLIVPSLDGKFIEKLNKFREVGNAAAHTLELNVSKKWLDENRDDLEFVTKILIRVDKNVP